MHWIHLVVWERDSSQCREQLSWVSQRMQLNYGLAALIAAIALSMWLQNQMHSIQLDCWFRIFKYVRWIERKRLNAWYDDSFGFRVTSIWLSFFSSLDLIGSRFALAKFLSINYLNWSLCVSCHWYWVWVWAKPQYLMCVEILCQTNGAKKPAKYTGSIWPKCEPSLQR